MKKFIATLSLAGATTFALFAFMAFLISNDQVGIVETAPPVVIDIFQTPEQPKPEVYVRKIFEPPVPPKPMPRTKMVADDIEANTDFTYKPTGLTIEGQNTDLGKLSNAPDNDARPIVRVNPKYPIDAARNGTEGWVVLAFDINAIGEVININILDSQPKRVFDSAAKQALRKWKYRAKSVNGKQVAQKNFTVQLDFNMNQQI
ncbi:energy transducer TonB [Colwelliaceae bacterium 6471]